mmetsp:Transcript_27273/g.71317  ORF Transcript_27273/g.71317 Transcript_27273/m.71317 type:complete len:207 (+) Transcript_27273:77-697(+)
MGALLTCAAPCQSRGYRRAPGDERQPPKWAHVGDGVGSYEEVQTLVYVGEGNGRYSVEDPALREEPAGCCGASGVDFARICYITIMVSLVLAGAACLTVSALSDRGKGVSKAPAVAAAAQEHPGGHLRSAASVTSTGKGYDCLSEKDPWPREQEVWCCEQEAIGCPELDCEAGASNWQEDWSKGKKQWCCDHAGAGCEDPSRPEPA